MRQRLNLPSQIVMLQLFRWDCSACWKWFLYIIELFHPMNCTSSVNWKVFPTPNDMHAWTQLWSLKGSHERAYITCIWLSSFVWLWSVSARFNVVSCYHGSVRARPSSSWSDDRDASRSCRSHLIAEVIVQAIVRHTEDAEWPHG